ncbi:MAG: response regulator transcription factor [Anaerolineae bacterium]|nr:response regulator transcription factor [Anaerolineae bacterium]
MAPIRVILADDHAVVRKGIRQILEEAGDIEVVAEAGDGEEALALVAEHNPDVLVLDIRMPRLSGVDVTRRVAAEYPGLRVLVLTAYDDNPYVFALLKAGAAGYILKTADSDELVRAVRAVAANRSALAPEIAQKVLQHLSGGARNVGDEVVQELSERELQVLRLAGKGLTNRAIGVQLAISDRTVQGHLANIYSKLHVTTRTEAVLKAVRLGWLTLDETQSR